MTLDDLREADDPRAESARLGALADAIRRDCARARAILASGTVPWVRNRLAREIRDAGRRLVKINRRIARLNDRAAAEGIAIAAAAEELAGLSPEVVELILGPKET